MQPTKVELAAAAISFESSWPDTGKVQMAGSGVTDIVAGRPPGELLGIECQPSNSSSMQEVEVVFGEELGGLVPDLADTIAALPLAIKSVVVCVFSEAFVFKVYHANQEYCIHYLHEHWCDASLQLQHTVVQVGLPDQSKVHRMLYSHSQCDGFG